MTLALAAIHAGTITTPPMRIHITATITPTITRMGTRIGTRMSTQTKAVRCRGAMRMDPNRRN
jgi:hypothetical protein